MLFAILMLPVMYLTAVWQVARANQPPFTDPLTWTIVPLAAIIPVRSAGVGRLGAPPRRDRFHKRLMLSAAIMVVMGPTIGRLADRSADPRPDFTFLLLLGFVLFVPLIVRDRRTPRQSSSGNEARDRHGGGLGRVLACGSSGSILPWANVAAHLPGVGAKRLCLAIAATSFSASCADSAAPSCQVG